MDVFIRGEVMCVMADIALTWDARLGCTLTTFLLKLLLTSVLEGGKIQLNSGFVTLGFSSVDAQSTHT